MNLKERIIEILNDESSRYNDPYCKVTKTERGFSLMLGAMYEAPGVITFAKLQMLSELFGTVKIDVDDYSEGGCETCDYGSDYGHEIKIYEPTKNLEEISKLFGEDLFKE